MHKDEETEIKDKAICEDLLAAGYIEEVKPKRKVKANED